MMKTGTSTVMAMSGGVTMVGENGGEIYHFDRVRTTYDPKMGDELTDAPKVAPKASKSLDLEEFYGRTPASSAKATEAKITGEAWALVRNDIDDEVPERQKDDHYGQAENGGLERPSAQQLLASMRGKGNGNEQYNDLVLVGMNRDWVDLTDVFVIGDEVLIEIRPADTFAADDESSDVLTSWTNNDFVTYNSCGGKEEMYVHRICLLNDPLLTGERASKRMGETLRHCVATIYYSDHEPRHQQMQEEDEHTESSAKTAPSKEEEGDSDRFVFSRARSDSVSSVDSMPDRPVVSKESALIEMQKLDAQMQIRNDGRVIIGVTADEHKTFDRRAICVLPVETDVAQYRRLNPYSHVSHYGYASAVVHKMRRVLVKMYRPPGGVDDINTWRVISLRPLRCRARQAHGVVLEYGEYVATANSVVYGKILIPRRNTRTGSFTHLQPSTITEVWTSLAPPNPFNASLLTLRVVQNAAANPHAPMFCALTMQVDEMRVAYGNRHLRFSVHDVGGQPVGFTNRRPTLERPSEGNRMPRVEEEREVNHSGAPSAIMRGRPNSNVEQYLESNRRLQQEYQARTPIAAQDSRSRQSAPPPPSFRPPNSMSSTVQRAPISPPFEHSEERYRDRDPMNKQYNDYGGRQGGMEQPSPQPHRRQQTYRSAQYSPNEMEQFAIRQDMQFDRREREMRERGGQRPVSMRSLESQYMGNSVQYTDNQRYEQYAFERHASTGGGGGGGRWINNSVPEPTSQYRQSRSAQMQEPVSQYNRPSMSQLCEQQAPQRYVSRSNVYPINRCNNEMDMAPSAYQRDRYGRGHATVGQAASIASRSTAHSGNRHYGGAEGETNSTRMQQGDVTRRYEEEYGGRGGGVNDTMRGASYGYNELPRNNNSYM